MHDWAVDETKYNWARAISKSVSDGSEESILKIYRKLDGELKIKEQPNEVPIMASKAKKGRPKKQSVDSKLPA